jgi:hypothetical protein
MEEAATSEFNRAVSCTFVGKLWLLKIGSVGQFQEHSWGEGVRAQRKFAATKPYIAAEKSTIRKEEDEWWPKFFFF